MSMRWMLIVTLSAATLVGCSKPEDDPLGKEGDACQVDADCESALACRDMACVPRADGPDMGDVDGGNNGTDAGDNNIVVEDEDYFISYVLRDRSDSETLWLYDTSNETHRQISPEGTECRLGCWVSESFDYFVTARANGAAFDVLAAPLTGTLAVDGAPQPVATGVRNIEVNGDIVSYIREDAGENKAYFRPLDGSSEVLIGTIGQADSTEGDWHVDADAGVGVVYNATLQTMDVKIGDVGQEISTLAYTIDSSNYQETSGSYFGGSIPTAFSPDGKFMALVTQKAPLDYNNCTDGSQCTGPGQRCGRFGRCSAIEVAVHFFDLDALDVLGDACSSDDKCGPVHRCDIPAENAVDQAVCIPRRVVLGLPGDQMQLGETGCALTAGNDDYYYTDIRSPISFAPDNSLYLTAARSCADFNIEDADILRLRPTSDDYDVVFGNPGENFDPDSCYDPVEDKIDVTDCNVWVERGLVSPGGNEVAFIATNPNVIDSALAETNVDLWTVKADGTDHAWVGEHPELSVVQDIRIHPPQ